MTGVSGTEAAFLRGRFRSSLATLWQAKTSADEHVWLTKDGEVSTWLASCHHPPRLMSVLLSVGLSDCPYVQEPPPYCMQPLDSSWVCTPLHGDFCRTGPRSSTFREHKCGPSMFQVPPVPSPTYHSPTISRSFNASTKHPREEQIHTPWNP